MYTTKIYDTLFRKKTFAIHSFYNTANIKARMLVDTFINLIGIPLS